MAFGTSEQQAQVEEIEKVETSCTPTSGRSARLQTLSPEITGTVFTLLFPTHNNKNSFNNFELKCGDETFPKNQMQACKPYLFYIMFTWPVKENIPRIYDKNHFLT
jgi:hypothetical protein